MEAQDHQAQWFTFGGALFVGGLVVNTDWIFAVLSSSPGRNLSILEWPFLLSLVVAVVGIYVMLASYIKSWPLPGKDRVQFAKDQRYTAEATTALFHLMGTDMGQKREDLTEEEVNEWVDNLQNFVRAVWGNAEGASLVAVANLDATTPLELLRLNLDALSGTMQRCPILRVKEDFDPNGPVPWGPYLHARHDAKWGKDG